MILSIHDILMLSLQFLYAFGGMILIGSLIFNIMRNQALVNEKRLRFEQDFEVQLTSQLTEQRSRGAMNIRPSGVTKDTMHRGEARRESGKASGTLTGPGTSNDDVSLKPRQSSVRERASGQGKTRRYSVAASLAARGFEAKDIRHRVGLPQCEIDLIASIHDSHANGWRKAHQSMMDAIDSGV